MRVAPVVKVVAVDHSESSRSIALMLHPHRVGGVDVERWLVGVGHASVLLVAVEFPDDVLQGVGIVRGGGEVG